MPTCFDLSLNEKAITLPPPGDAVLRFIGRIRTPWKLREDCPRQGNHDGPDCLIQLEPGWAPALHGLEEYETIEVLYWMDRSRRDLVQQSPRADGRTVGTFALRSPVRPNPIGLSVVRLIGLDGAVLIVRGLDCIDGTPLIDLKPDQSIDMPRTAIRAVGSPDS